MPAVQSLIFIRNMEEIIIFDAYKTNHASWTSCAGLVLIGGGPYFHRTGDPLPDAELVTKDSSFAGFSLTFDIRWEFLSSLD